MNSELTDSSFRIHLFPVPLLSPIVEKTPENVFHCEICRLCTLIAEQQITTLMLLETIDPEHIHGVCDRIGISAWVLALESGFLLALAILKQAGANINFQDSLGRTALFYAVEQQDPYLLWQLLLWEGRVDIMDRERKSILVFALEQPSCLKMDECIHLLLWAGFSQGTVFLGDGRLGDLQGV